VATDGHRLALAEMPAPEGAHGLPGVIVPRKTVQEIRRLLDAGEETVDITASDAKITVKVGRAVLTSKLIDGSFPDYARVIPKGNDRILRLDNKGFEQAVDRVATVSGERSRSVKLHLVEDTLKLSVTHSETGAGQEEMEVEYRAAPLEIGFNARYLLDIAGQIEDANAVFELRDAASPALVRDPGDPTARYVLMPLRV
jgi:DNA polymerase-3 subunit beta